MSKPTFLQSVLGRPSRSYAADHYDPPPPPKPTNPYNPYQDWPSTSSRASSSSRRGRSYAATDVGYSNGNGRGYGYGPEYEYGFDSYGSGSDAAGPSRSRPAATAHPHSHSALGYAPQPQHAATYSHARSYSPDVDGVDGETMGYARSDLGLGLPPGPSQHGHGRRGQPSHHHDHQQRRIVSDGSVRSSQSVPASLAEHTGRSALQDLPDPPPPHVPPKPYVRPVHIVPAPRHEYEYDPSPPSSSASSMRGSTVRRQSAQRPSLQTFSAYGPGLSQVGSDGGMSDKQRPKLPRSPLSSTAGSAVGSATPSSRGSDASASARRVPEPARVPASVPVTGSNAADATFASASASASTSSVPDRIPDDSKVQVPAIVMDMSDAVTDAQSGNNPANLMRRKSSKRGKGIDRRSSIKSYKSGKSSRSLGGVSDSEDDEFHTPRSSFDFSNMGHGDSDDDEKLPDPHETPVSEVTVLPTLKVQPPTPMNDPTTPPLERELSDHPDWSGSSGSSGAEASLRPGRTRSSSEPDEAEDEAAPLATTIPPSQGDVKAPSSKPPKAVSMTSLSSVSDVPPPVPPKSPTRSRGGRVRAAHMTILNAPGSTSPSPSHTPLPPPKIAPMADVPLRRSKSAKNVATRAIPKDLPLRPSSRSEFRAMSELARTSRGRATPPMSPTEGIDPRRPSGSAISEAGSFTRSVEGGVRTAGYGKGGWAAASAEPVVMYMPQDGGDGWAAFQPQPPRSRFSVLPPSQMPVPVAQYPRQPSFGSGSTGSSSLGPSASASQDGRYVASPPVASPASLTNGVLPSHPAMMRRYEPSALSRSSSLFDPRDHVAATGMVPVALAPPSLTTSPAPTSPVTTPDDSDDDWEGERPSRSYIRKPADEPSAGAGATPASPTSYKYGSEIGTAAPRSESVVKFDFGPEQRIVPSLSYDPYADARSVAPRVVRPEPPLSPPPLPPPSVSHASQYSSHSGSLSRSSSKRSNFPPRSSYADSSVPRLPQLPPQVPLDPALRALGTTSPQAEPSETMSFKRVNLDRPSSINPDLLTFLPVMTTEASDRLYTESEHGHHRRWGSDGVHRSRSLKGLSKAGGAMSDIGGYGYGDRRKSREDDRYIVGSTRTATSAKSANSIRRTPDGVISLDGPEKVLGNADIIATESQHHDARVGNGYTNLTLPHSVSYTPLGKPKTLKDLDKLDTRVASLPHSSMAAITLSSSFQTARERQEAPTPEHLKRNLPPPVEFTSHIPPPTKVGSAQVLVQVYAVAIDENDISALDDKGMIDIGKYVPGRSFVGRALVVGEYERDLQRGDLVIGLLDIRKSGALCEYLLVDRRRIARVPPGGDLSLEQLALLPLQGITTLRALRGILARGARALVMDAHEGVPALMCQAMAAAGVHVTAVISSGEDNVLAQAQCIAHGARGFLAGSPAAAMLSMEEGVFHVVVDTRGGTKVYEAARRALVDGGHLLSLVRDGTSGGKLKSKTIRWGFKRTRITTTYVPAAGTGEPTVDASGLDPRDVMEEPGMDDLVPAVGSSKIVPFEKGAEVFSGRGGIVRIIN